MSSYGHLYIQGFELMSFRDEVDPTMMLLFTAGERRTRRYRPRLRDRYEPDDDGMVSCIELAAPVAVLRDRLDVLGIGRRMTSSVFSHLVADRLGLYTGWSHDFGGSDAWARHVGEEIAALQHLDLEAWCTEVRTLWRRRRRAAGRMEVGSLAWLFGLWDGVDPRLVMRAVIEALPHATELVIDVTELVEGGWLQDDLSPREAALEHFTWAAANGSPVIILTEGRTDARIIADAIRVVRSHLEDFLRVAEFSGTREGGAGALANTVRSFAAAGVANRVVALFDNDTSASDALSTLELESLPANITVLRLPPLEVAARYPTLGPTGEALMDINGLAGSIELYLGLDVLRRDDGQLEPVQWRGFQPKLGRYQGELLDKARVQDAFSEKVRAALSDPSMRETQDWSGIELLIDHIVKAVAESDD